MRAFMKNLTLITIWSKIITIWSKLITKSVGVPMYEGFLEFEFEFITHPIDKAGLSWKRRFEKIEETKKEIEGGRVRSG